MKKIIFAVFALLFISTTQAGAQTQLFVKGDKAPGFSAVSHNNDEIELKELIKKGPVVMLFYRGYWCPYCSKQLSQLQDSMSLLMAKNVTVLAITPETYESVDKTIEKTKAAFTIISDTTNAIMKLYGVNFTVEDKTVERYKTFNIDLVKSNGNSDNVLPVPGVFVIGKDGKFKYVYFDNNYRLRPSVASILKSLED